MRLFLSRPATVLRDRVHTVIRVETPDPTETREGGCVPFLVSQGALSLSRLYSLHPAASIPAPSWPGAVTRHNSSSLTRS